MKIAKINSYTPNSYRVLQNQNTNQNSNKNSISQNYAQSNNEVSFGKSSGFVNKVILPILAAFHLSSCAPAVHEVNKVEVAADALATRSVVCGTKGDSLGAELNKTEAIIRKSLFDMKKTSNPDIYKKALGVYELYAPRKGKLEQELQQHIVDSIYLSTKQRKHDSILIAYLKAYEHHNIEEQIQRINKELSQTKDPTKRKELKSALEALKTK